MDNTSKKYIVYIFNNWFIVPFILLGMILPLIISMSFFNNESPTFLIITLVIFTIASYFLTRKFGLRPIQVQFDTEKFIIQFLTKDLKKVKRQKIILMKNINGFSDFTFGQHDTFKLKLQRNLTYNIYKNGFFNKEDDFEILTSDFKAFISNYNKADNANEVISPQRKKIEYEDFFQTPKATVLFYITIVIGIWTIHMFASGKSHSSSGPFIVMGGILGYIGTYLLRRNFRNKK